MKNFVKIFSAILILITITGCKKKPEPPSVTTKTITEITTVSASTGGDIISDGGAQIISLGVCWNISDKPVVTDFKTTDNDMSDSFISKITSLSPNTTYFVRAYATNSAGTSYGSTESFKTLGGKPVPAAVNATDINTTSATLNGSVNPGSLATTVSFEFGLTTSYGNTSAAVQSPLNGESINSVSTAVTGLNPGTIYHFRLKAENSLGISYSDDLTFTTLGGIPQVTLLKANNIKMYTATISGKVMPNYFTTNVIFEWGATTSYGHSVSYLQNPLTGNVPMDVSLNIDGLEQATTYHFRIKAGNDLGLKISDDFSFATLGPVTDVDGNIYNIVTIGTQVWMSKNLATTKLNDGNDIPLVSDPAIWGSTSAAGYCWYDNNKELYKSPYGAMYNFYSILTGKLCPAGWHVPSKDEWAVLFNFLTGNGYGYEGSGDDIAKSLSSTQYWQSSTTPGDVGNDIQSNNASGFSAVPAGGRDALSGVISALGFAEAFWTSSLIITNMAYVEVISYMRSDVTEGSAITGGGYSVRCLHDSDK
jgi:uncharacterized protein (TIGR02145 family)